MARDLFVGFRLPSERSFLICCSAGIYDDHDFGWNNGNGREPQKRAYKELYLDAIGTSNDHQIYDQL